jgi:hypothetical protein
VLGKQLVVRFRAALALPRFRNALDVALLEDEDSVVSDLVNVAPTVSRHRIKVCNEILAVGVARVEIVDKLLQVRDILAG